MNRSDDSGRKTPYSAPENPSLPPCHCQDLIAAWFAAAKDPVFITDPDEIILTANPAACRLVDAPVTEITGQKYHQILHGKETPPDGCPLHAAIATQETAEGEVVMEKTGAIFQIQATPVWHNGQFTAVVHVARDISEQKKAEQKLKSSERRLAEAQKIAHIGNWEWKIRENSLWWSDEIYRIFGISPNAFPATYDAFLDAIHPEDRNRVEQSVTAALHHGTPYDIEHRIVRPDGTIRVVHEEGHVETDPEGEPCRMAGTVHDITRRKHLENQLIRSQKMEAIGRLTGGVAHDFNNLLSLIIGYSELLLQDLSDPVVCAEHARTILDAGHNASALTRQLLSFSRKQILAPKKMVLNDQIEELSSMLDRLIGASVTMTLRLSATPTWIHADPAQIQQILMNLCVNARDAMPDGGCLVIETTTEHLDPSFARSHPGCAIGPHVCLSVSDTGVGIPEPILEKIFDPFFTTKGNHGTGMGLSTVFGIVRQHNGQIYPYSEPGVGTVFKVYLPLLQGETAETTPQQVPETPKGSERILVVDDNPAILKLVADTLIPLGYAVVTAVSPQAAIAFAQTPEVKIDLLLTDVMMPKINGPELARRIIAFHPQILTVFMSGYTDNIIAHHGILKEGIRLIQKPIIPSALGLRIRHVLDGTDPMEKMPPPSD